jgi:hypothetical protein
MCLHHRFARFGRKTRHSERGPLRSRSAVFVPGNALMAALQPSVGQLSARRLAPRPPICLRLTPMGGTPRPPLVLPLLSLSRKGPHNEFRTREKPPAMTGSAEVWIEPQDAPTIGGNRRGGRRYELQLEVRWKLMHRRRVLKSGTGRTRDLSSRGILFETDRPLPVGSRLELAVSWPALLHGEAALNLTATGRVVRSDRTCTAIRMIQHGFRTAGSPTHQLNRALAASRSIPVWNARGSPAA